MGQSLHSFFGQCEQGFFLLMVLVLVYRWNAEGEVVACNVGVVCEECKVGVYIALVAGAECEAVCALCEADNGC